MNWLIPLLASLIGIVFAVKLFSSWRRKTKASTFWYAVSLGMFSIAVFIEFYADAFGWNVAFYKSYYFLAISLVAYMAVGTIYLFTSRRWGPLFLAYSVIVCAFFLYELWNAPVNTAVLASSNITVGGAAFEDPSIRQYSLYLSAVGGVVVFGGAIYSYWKTRAVGHLYIALAALTMSIGGRLGKMGLVYALPITELIGILFLYYGVFALQKSASSIQENAIS